MRLLLSLMTGQGRRKQFSCGQAKFSQCIVLGSGVRKHAKSRGVRGHAPPGKF